MNIEQALEKDTSHLLDDPLLVGSDVDSKVIHLLESEYLRRGAQYRRVDLALTSKYGMSLDEFLVSGVTRQQQQSWEVEKDAMDWETAIDGIETVKNRLQRLRAVTNEDNH